MGEDYDDPFDELMANTLKGGVEVLVLLALAVGIFIWRFL